MALTHCTLSGADNKTSIEKMFALAAKYPLVEYGILWSAKRAGTPRYPDAEWIRELTRTNREVCEDNRIRLAMHLCGSSVDDFLFGYDGFNWGHTFRRIPVDFRRIQFNINGREWVQNHGEDAPDALSRLYKCINKLYTKTHSGPHPIIQFNTNNLDLYYLLGHVRELQLLIDASGGQGMAPTRWQRKIPRVTCGYAGGLGPHNIQQQFPLIEHACKLPSGFTSAFWIDMESGIRTNDQFDFAKAEEVLKYVTGRAEGMLSEQRYEQVN